MGWPAKIGVRSVIRRWIPFAGLLKCPLGDPCQTESVQSATEKPKPTQDKMHRDKALTPAQSGSGLRVCNRAVVRGDVLGGGRRHRRAPRRSPGTALVGYARWSRHHHAVAHPGAQGIGTQGRENGEATGRKGRNAMSGTLQPAGGWWKLVLREVQTLFRFSFEDKSSLWLSWLSDRDYRALRSWFRPGSLSDTPLGPLRELLEFVIEHENVIADRHGKVEDILRILPREGRSARMGGEVSV
jgi:hypothetical protein